MKAPLLLLAVGAVMMVGTSNPTLAQMPDAPPGNMPGQPPQGAGNPTLQPAYDPTEPNPITGVLQPPPGPPPEGNAAQIKLPDCAPPNCGTPQIMAE